MVVICFFVHPSLRHLMNDGVIVALITVHVDDWVVITKPSLTGEMIGMFSSSFLVKVTGKLPAGVCDSEWSEPSG